MSDHDKLQTLLAITRVLEEAVTNCEFELALRLQDELRQRLAALNPLAVLERGFAVVNDANGQSIHHTAQVSPGQALNVRVQDGSFGVLVKESGSRLDPQDE